MYIGRVVPVSAGAAVRGQTGCRVPHPAITRAPRGLWSVWTLLILAIEIQMPTSERHNKWSNSALAAFIVLFHH